MHPSDNPNAPSRKAGPAESRYQALLSERQPFLDRARFCAKYTIPHLMPEDHHNGNHTFSTPWSALPAQAVNNLASKMLLALLPPNTSIFRYKLDVTLREELAGLPHPDGSEGSMADAIEDDLALIETRVVDEVEGIAMRPQVFEAFRQLLVSGNVCLDESSETNLKVHPLHSYVVQRDGEGRVIELVILERVTPEVLPEEIQSELRKDGSEALPSEDVNLYTHVTFKGKDGGGGMYHYYQEAAGFTLPESEGSVKEEESPWIVLRYNRVDNEDYGRSYVEEYLGDIISLEELQKAIVKGATAAAKVVFLVRPNGSTDSDEIAEADSGDIKDGDAEDVSVLQMEKYADFRVARETMEDIKGAIRAAFLMHSSVQRQAERVTAAEVRFMAAELEDALGGMYSLLAQEFQLPLVKRLLSRLARKNKIPALPKEAAHPQITTGLEALGRNHELQKLQAAFASIPEALFAQVAPRINAEEVLRRIFRNLAVDDSGLIRSQAEIQQEQQQAMMAEMAGKLGPEVIRQAGNQLTTNAEAQAE